MQDQQRWFRFARTQRGAGINGTFFDESCGRGNAVYSAGRGLEKPLDQETKKGGEKVAGPVSVEAE